MPEAGGQEKTEQATPKRLEDARQKGNVAKSVELGSAAVLIAGVLSLLLLGGLIYEEISSLFVTLLSQAGQLRLDQGDGPAVFWMDVIALAKTTLPVMGVVFVAAVLANYFQVGSLFTLEPLKPKLSKINPAKGLKRYFSLRIVIDAVKNVAKVSIVGFVGYRVVVSEMDALPGLANLTVPQIAGYIVTVSIRIFVYCALFILALALADYMYRRWDYLKNLRMTKQEIKDEYKQREGDPHVKQRIRSIQRKMAMERMMEAVPKADVVVTNPTHLAVALSYRSGLMTAPKVVAKGADLVAERIRKLAKEHGVPLVEDKPLAQALFKLKVGQVIPEDLFQAVAQVLAYVYQLKHRPLRVARQRG